MPPPERHSSRPMRLRSNPAIRAAVRETEVLPRHLIQPLFIAESAADAVPIEGLPGQRRLTAATIQERARQAQDVGLGGVLLFPVPATKAAPRPYEFSPGRFFLDAIAAARDAAPDLLLATDVCLCPYTHDGQCVLSRAGTHAPDLPATLDAYGHLAAAHATAGAHVVAPSGMIDGTVAAVRDALDRDGHDHSAILAYSVKYASSLYGPFRTAARSAPTGPDRRWHQMDPSNANEALREVRLDLDQGADLVMIKPALHYLDVIAAVHRAHPCVPVAAYHVSGEYAMLHAAAANGWLDYAAALDEALTAIRRAGASLIITYAAIEYAQSLDPAASAPTTRP
jgi:porphobilinogen synthase